MALTPKFFQTRHSPRFLIIEDELQLVEWLDHKISEFGYVVSASAGTVWTARQELKKLNFDAVLLDAGLHQQHSTEIADLLLAKKIPFAFLAGRQEHWHLRMLAFGYEAFTSSGVRPTMADRKIARVG